MYRTHFVTASSGANSIIFDFSSIWSSFPFATQSSLQECTFKQQVGCANWFVFAHHKSNGVVFLFAFRRVTLLLLAQKEVTKEKSTPLPRPSASLRCFKKLGAAELALTSHTNRGLSRSSNSPRSKSPNFLNHHRRGSRGWKSKPAICVSPSPLMGEGLGRGCHSRVCGNLGNSHA